MVDLAAQGLHHQLADIVYDPFVEKEQAEQGGDLVAHFQATLIDGNDFYMESKSGTYIPPARQRRLGERSQLRSECLESAHVERHPLYLATREAGADLDIRE
jgi:hypothetical protein